MRPNVSLVLATLLAASLPASCQRAAPTGRRLRLQPTCAIVEVLHGGVTVDPGDGDSVHPRVSARVEIGGRLRTDANGRAIVHTDDGLELRLAGDTVVSFHDAHPRLERGRVFLTSWGDVERAVDVGVDVTLGVSDVSAELERAADGAARVITVRGDLAWRSRGRQGRVQQGESLEGRAELRVRPAGVWDDWTGGAASPQGVAQRGALGLGTAYIHTLAGELPAALAINEHRVQVRIEGDVAVTTVSQRFFNGSDRTAPVEYRVRLPDEAIVAAFNVDRDGTVNTGTPGTVSSLSASGGRAALLRGAGGELFARLDPLASGQTVRCEIRYVEWLHHDGGWRTYTYPMGDPVQAPFVGEFSLDLQTSSAAFRAFRAPQGAQIEIGRVRYARSDFRPRGDFQIEMLDSAPPATPSARMWQPPWQPNESESYALFDLTLPPADDLGTDLIVVLDDSAAMNTGMLSVAAAAVDAMLHLLGPNDRIALMFGDLRARPATGSPGELGPPTSERREAMLDAIARARPGGATHLVRMLGDAYARLDPRRNGAVVYLGDATPTMGPMNADHLADETLRIAPDLRLYVLALGDDAHPEVLSGLAARGGRIESASDQPGAVASASRLAAHALRPALRDVQLDLGPSIARPLPDRIEQWVVGDPLRVSGLLAGRPPSRIRVQARVGRQIRRWEVPVHAESVVEEGDIRRRWALARWNSLDRAGATRGALADLGVRFGLITPTSALILGAPSVVATADGNVGYDCAMSEWPEVGLHSRLPRLGVDSEVAPRGVHGMNDNDESPTVTDDGSGWQRHRAGENLGATGALEATLGVAEPRLWACYERSRALRPALAGQITVRATIGPDGQVTNTGIDYSSLADAGAESCMRTALTSLVVPAPSLLGLPPGIVTRAFQFRPSDLSRRGAGCPPTSRVSRATRMVLWRERIIGSRGQLVRVWQDAVQRCELRVWEDRVGLMDLLVRAATDPSELAQLRAALQPDARDYFDRAVSRRWGPSRVWRAYLAQQGFIDWDSLVRRLNDATVPLDQKIRIATAYIELAPQDVDLRLRVMALYERAGRTREARRMGDELRRDAFSDARVRGLVGEMLLRLGDREEGLRTFSEMAEFAPYDTGARTRLGDLLLTFGGREWAGEAYLQYQTLAALQPGDPVARVRMAIAAVAAGREDEALRLLRAVAEDTGAEISSEAAEALLVAEVSRLGLTRANDPAVDQWARVARLMRTGRDGALIARWDHPDAGLELRTLQAGDVNFLTIGTDDAPFNMRIFSPQSAMEGSRVLLRANSGLTPGRNFTAHLTLLVPGGNGPSVVDQNVELTTERRIAAYVVRGGRLVEDTAPIPATERPTPNDDLY